MTRRIVRRPAAETAVEEEEDPTEEETPEEETPEEEEQEEPEEGDEEDEDENGAAIKRDVVRAGWGGYKRTRALASGFAEFFRPEKEAQVLKFLDAEPFAAFRQHWIEREGKKSFICLEDGCPLCDIGDRPSFRVDFNVLVLSEDEPVVRVWEVGPRLGEQLEGLAQDRLTGPLDKPGLYWAISRTGKKSKTSYTVRDVEERDLESRYGIEPLTADEITRYKKKSYDAKVIRVQSVADLQEIAMEVSDEEE